MNPALGACAAWIIMALAFNAGIYAFQGQQKALEFFTGYVIELSLSIDNLFVFFLIFSHFKINAVEQGKVLRWGVWGAQLMRAIFILGGVALLKALSWMIYVFGALLVFSGFKFFFKKDKTISLERNSTFLFLKRLIPGGLSTFWVVLLAVEMADVVFAVDSIPAVLAVTKDPFIVYTSNIFAILGLRAMYVVFVPIVDKFQYLHYTLGIILMFVGGKMLTDTFWHMPIGYALGFIALVLSIFVLISFWNGRNKEII